VGVCYYFSPSLPFFSLSLSLSLSLSCLFVLILVSAPISISFTVYVSLFFCMSLSFSVYLISALSFSPLFHPPAPPPFSVSLYLCFSRPHFLPACLALGKPGRRTQPRKSPPGVPCRAHPFSWPELGRARTPLPSSSPPPGPTHRCPRKAPGLQAARRRSPRGDRWGPAPRCTGSRRL